MIRKKNTLKNWIGAVCKYKCIDYKRKYYKEYFEELDETIPDEKTPEKEMLRREMEQETEELLSCLCASDREIFRRRYIEEETIKEISAGYFDVDSVAYRIKRVDEMSKELDEDKDISSFVSEAELAEVLGFDLKVPKSLPEGFSLVKAYGFKDENGKVSPDYAVLVYGNGEKEFSIHERRDSEETKFETGLSGAKVIDFDGVDAVYTENEFECSWDGVTVSVMGQKAISGETILDVAKSMK